MIVLFKEVSGKGLCICELPVIFPPKEKRTKIKS